MTTYEILDLIFSFLGLVLGGIALGKGISYINSKKDNQKVGSQTQTSKGNNSPNVGRDFNTGN